jgi:hypothetical protein
MWPSCFLVWALHWNYWVYTLEVVSFLAIVFMLHTIASCYCQYSSFALYDCIIVKSSVKTFFAALALSLVLLSSAPPRLCHQPPHALFDLSELPRPMHHTCSMECFKGSNLPPQRGGDSIQPKLANQTHQNLARLTQSLQPKQVTIGLCQAS